jgi:hypothetical protein
MAWVNPDVFTNGIADIYIADALVPAAASPATAPTPPPTPAARPVTLSAEEVSDKTGLYRFVLQDWPIS